MNNPAPPAAAGRRGAAMEVSYRSTYFDLCRCTFYSLTHRWHHVWRLLPAVACGTLVNGRSFAFLGWLQYPVAACVMSLVLGVLLVVILNLLILPRFLKPRRQQGFTTRLHEGGVADVSAKESKLLPWVSLSEIRYHRGDLFFWPKNRDGFFVPRSAFKDLHESQAFFEAARHFWEAAKSGQPVPAASDDTVWPPAPRVTP